MGTSPPCGQCWDGIRETNAEAYEVYQMACVDSMGVNLQGIETACRLLRVKDPDECILKVKELVFEIRKLEEEKRKEKESIKKLPREF